MISKEGVGKSLSPSDFTGSGDSLCPIPHYAIHEPMPTYYDLTLVEEVKYNWNKPWNFNKKNHLENDPCNMFAISFRVDQ